MIGKKHLTEDLLLLVEFGFQSVHVSTNSWCNSDSHQDSGLVPKSPRSRTTQENWTVNTTYKQGENEKQYNVPRFRNSFHPIQTLEVQIDFFFSYLSVLGNGINSILSASRQHKSKFYNFFSIEAEQNNRYATERKKLKGIVAIHYWQVTMFLACYLFF